MKNINISNFIENEIQKSESILEFVKKFRNIFQTKKVEDDMYILESILKKLEENSANPLLLDLLSDFLQIIDDEQIIKTYKLEDIEKLLINNTKIQNLNLSFLEDLIYFYWNVMDDEKKSKYYINEGILHGEIKINDFKKLLFEIENNIIE